MARGKHEKKRVLSSSRAVSVIEREPNKPENDSGSAGRRVPKPLTAIMCLALVCIIIWGAFVYSPTPFITRWREYFISSAMSTFRHQWLATALMPSSVIDGVMKEAEEEWKQNEIDKSEAPPIQDTTPVTPSNPGSSADPHNPVVDPGHEEIPIPDTGNELIDAFLEEYYQIDPDTLPEDFASWGLPSMKVKDIADKGIKTRQGDRVWAIDTINGILIIEIKGETRDGKYEGKLAIVKDSSQTIMAAVPANTEYGYTVRRFVSRNGGILGINANPFVDSKGDGTTGNGTGNLEHAIGLIVSNGKVVHKRYGEESYQMGGFDYDNNFLVGTKLNPKELRDAGEFKPVLVANGESRIFTKSSFGMGIQPRSAIGQTDRKETLLLIIDGRNATGWGTTVAEVASILVRYNCWNALGNDGGSSAVMVYDGVEITDCSAVSSQGRNLPCAWVVKAR
ncbi:MAG: phosphodiester glycosidase family protein [Oscillospiraceae bacterium]|nr:phosphodiester glycosidase family protein [Oscillospiraceae bacterium]MBQ3986211.1 phosphodiester glycosidase family protein [Oscillospiraceae bacterium]